MLDFLKRERNSVDSFINYNDIKETRFYIKQLPSHFFKSVILITEETANVHANGCCSCDLVTDLIISNEIDRHIFMPPIFNLADFLNKSVTVKPYSDLTFDKDRIYYILADYKNDNICFPDNTIKFFSIDRTKFLIYRRPSLISLLINIITNILFNFKFIY